MRIATYQIFDDFISGTGSSWYSGAELNRLLGAADFYAIHAIATNVGGTNPTLTVSPQYSSDGQRFYKPGDDIVAGALVNNGSLIGSNPGLSPVGANLRFQISLGASAGTPQCRLKLYFTGRAG